jgi:hypothetical protein
VAFAEAEVTGKIVHETAAFTQGGIGIGAATSVTQTADSHGQDIFKIATHAKVFVDGDVSDSATYHVEINAFKDLDADAVFDSNESYTQNDLLREAYVDTEVEGVSLRVGKQQVVWGTADGMKLLDSINPTDFSEMAQNQMEDSRLPIWMINAETETGNGGSVQLILSEARGNKIAGMGIASATAATSHTNGDSGHSFIMKGADTLTGKVHGFMNMAPALGKVATFFASGGQGLASITALAANGLNGMANLTSAYADDTVAEFVGDYALNKDLGAAATAVAGSYSDFRALCGNGQDTTLCDAYGLDFIAESTAQGLNDNVTNLIDANTSGVENSVAGWNTGTESNSLFEYMDQATFGTFAAFVNMKSKYLVEEASGLNTALKYTGAQGGLNYSLNYLNRDDAMPYVDVSFQNTAGNTLTMDHSATNNTVTLYTDSSKGTAHNVNTHGAAVMVFKEKHAPIQSFGGSFDTAIETGAVGPVVLRGEFMYDKDVMTPVVDRAYLRIGHAVKALTNQKGDRFSYVLGADITRLTNMMVSAQFIQIRNLDFVDSTTTIDASQSGIETVTGARYTANPATMHMTNGLQKAEENTEFVSVFLSKPFGASGEHRWNNITMYEENGGLWNRLDAEYSIDDDTQATVEYNKYWGNENTQFGQLAASSNIQVGVKYSF